MFSIYVAFQCFSGMREAFVEEMKKQGILDAIRAENGCIAYNYYYADHDPNQLLLIETWESKCHQEVHIMQPHMEKMRAFKDRYIESTVLGEFELK